VGNKKTARTVCFISAVTLTLAAFMVSLAVGKFPITLSEIGSIIFGGEIAELKRNVFFTLRLPRTILAVLAGIGLGMAGSVYQTIFKNPLASPDIIGVASGANLGAAVAIIFFGGNTVLLASSAFVGGLLVMLMVISLVRVTGQNNTPTYVLAGIVMKAVSEALIMILKFYADPERELAAIEYWSMGSFANITMTKLLVVLPFFFTGFFGIVLLRRQVSLLGLGEDESRSLGVNVKYIRIAVLCFSTLMVTSVISVTGLISFVGLIAPHLARLVLKRTSFSSIMFASICGAFILTAADCFARTIYTSEVPISILTTLIGVPILVYFMRGSKGART